MLEIGRVPFPLSVGAPVAFTPLVVLDLVVVAFALIEVVRDAVVVLVFPEIVTIAGDA